MCSTMCLSIEARISIIGLFLPHIMAADPWWPPQAKRRKKGLARLCGSTLGALVLCLQRLRRNWRHIIWRQFATIWFMPTFGDVTLWNIPCCFLVIPHTSTYIFPWIASSSGGIRFRYDTNVRCPCLLVTRDHHTTPHCLSHRPHRGADHPPGVRDADQRVLSSVCSPSAAYP